jgi:hypothetical protein
MKELRAFVGHSFSELDKALVGTFCDHFENLAKANLNFSWDHAVEAEPSPLSKKVLAKIDGKNVFIGICTKSELAIRDTSLRPGFFRKNVLSADADKFSWKASDWIIQEIGLAVGRNMSIILFLEDGMREPGGLYGDIEYIPFSRQNPQASFDKMLQMLLSLSPRDLGAATTSVEPPPTEKEVIAEASADLEPTPDWTKKRYNEAMTRAVIDGNNDALERISASFHASKHSQELGAAEWEGRIEWLRILLLRGGDFEKLRRLANENPTSSLLQMHVARGYAEFGDHEKAGEAFQKAASAVDNEDDRALYDSDAAIQYARAGELKRGLAIFNEVKKVASGKPALGKMIVDDLRSLAQIEKLDELELAAMEQAVELKPTDWQLRFMLVPTFHRA